MIDFPNNIQNIFDKLIENGIKPIVVGGYIRDFLLKKDSKDIDVELYNLSSLEQLEQILQNFGTLKSVGKSFGVLKLASKDYEIDFSLPRNDSKIAQGHKGFLITIDTSLNFTQAARRRDFTINAIGFDTTSKKLLDPYNGVDDIKNKILRCVDATTFVEDPLRFMRAIGFATRFEFTIEKELFSLLESMINANLLEELPQERIFTELEKILLKAKKPSYAFFLMQQLHLQTYLPHKDSLRALDLLSPKDLTLSFAILAYKQKYKEKFLSLFTHKKSAIKTASLLAQHLEDFSFDNLSNYQLYKIAIDVKLEQFFSLLYAFFPQKKYKIQHLSAKAKELSILHHPLKPIIQGKDLLLLGMKPSQHFSKILKHIYELQMMEKITTKEDALKEAKRYL